MEFEQFLAAVRSLEEERGRAPMEAGSLRVWFEAGFTPAETIRGMEDPFFVF